MSALSQIALIRLSGEAPTKTRRDTLFQSEHVVDPSGDQLEACLATLEADYVALADAYVEPLVEQVQVSLEPELLSKVTCMGLLGLNTINGMIARRGLVLARRDAAGARPRPNLILPRVAFHWSPNISSEAAFKAGFKAMPQPDRLPEQPHEKAQLALAASLGADVSHGLWWCIGCHEALLHERDMHKAWDDLQGISVSDQTRHIAHLARRIRTDRDIAVHPLEAAKSKAMKQMLHRWPPAAFWHDFVKKCDALSPEGAALAASFKGASDLIWGQTA